MISFQLPLLLQGKITKILKIFQSNYDTLIFQIFKIHQVHKFLILYKNFNPQIEKSYIKHYFS